MTLLLPLSIVPPVAFFSAAMRSDDVIIDTGEHYVHQTVRNRYHVLSPNGVVALTIPVKSQGGEKVPSQDVLIDYSKPWQRLHLRTLEAAYRSAPFYDYYIDEIAALLNSGAPTLGRFFEISWPLWLKLLKLDLKYKISPTFVENCSGMDYRERIKLPEWFEGRELAIPYPQVFADRFGFVPHLSIADLIFNEGPAAAYCIRPI